MQSRHFVYPILHQLTNPSLNKLKLYTEGAAQMNVKIKKKTEEDPPCFEQRRGHQEDYY